jgi:hypothetical protein
VEGGTAGKETAAANGGPSTPQVRDIAQAGPTTETLKQVAVLYQLAVIRGDAPTLTVADTLGVPRSTAGRWVTRAGTAATSL